MKRLILLVTLAVFATLASAASAALPNQRTDMKVLLLAANGSEPTTAAWEAAMKREGVPYETKVASPGHTPYTAETFADTLADGTPHATYQAVIIAIGGLPYQDEAGNYVSALSGDEWAALASFEEKYGIRRITAYTYPSAEYGLNTPTVSGDMYGVTANLTTAGKKVFPYLKGPIPIDQGTWGYQSTPASGATFQTLVSGPASSAVLGIHTLADGRQNMVSTIDVNQYNLHGNLLRHGMLSWVTRGVYLGTERNYLTVQVDDIFEESERWDTVTNSETSVKPLRMTSADVPKAVQWSKTNGFRLDMAFNAAGSVEAGAKDKLTQAFLADKKSFYWINHTYSHPNLDNSSLAELKSEIQQNVDWARKNRVTIDPTELVTGEHSGLFNPNMAQALTETGVKWFGDDASRRPHQWQLGPATSVSRYPTNVYYNAATRAQQLDEYNYLYLPPSLGGNCQNTATTTCFSQPATWNQYVDREATTMMRHVLGNDPRPHYVHQANLAADGTLYSVLNEVLKRYRAYFKPALVQPVHKQAGELLGTQAKWETAASQVEAYTQNGMVHIRSSASTPVQVPVAGVTAGLGAAYGGLVSGWTSVPAGGALQFNITP